MSKAVLYLHALTPMHPGSGTALGVVDLPVQRERHTQWPLIPGSSLKGVLRDHFREQMLDFDNEEIDTRRKADGNPRVTRLFGPPTIGADEGKAHAGALSITDARILAFPVRSLRGVFAWITCPAVLTRLQRDLAVAGFQDVPEHLDVKPDEAYLAEGSPLLVGNKVLLEEFEFNTKHHKDLPDLFEWLAEQVFNADESPELFHTQEQIRQRMVILSDDDFTHFVRHATEVMARVGLDYNTKTVKDGALFYEEFLPAETLFYSLVLADEARSAHKSQNMDAAAVMADFKEGLPQHLQIGGDATIGKGLCAVTLRQGGNAQ
ncbi:MAG: type III-B CRISPR module RAMP protein Cmr4 [Candidatus Sericytochromatia bacterium]|nr:type III-B CRISPR module RAMP protein Cmr4 [Candidatus Sericytochromatia bacterium]